MKFKKSLSIFLKIMIQETFLCYECCMKLKDKEGDYFVYVWLGYMQFDGICDK